MGYIKTFESFMFDQYTDYGCNYILKFLKENPKYDNEHFLDYLALNNRADRDYGEFQDISKDEIERVAYEYKKLDESELASFKELIDIELDLHSTKHSDERSDERSISNKDLESFIRRAIDEIAEALMFNKVKFGQKFILKDTASDLHVVCSAYNKNERIKLVAITLMKEKNFKIGKTYVINVV